MRPGRGSNRSSATANVTLYCTWRPSGLTIGLHGQDPSSNSALKTTQSTNPNSGPASSFSHPSPDLSSASVV